MVSTAEHAQELAHVGRLLIDEQPGEAVHAADRFLRAVEDPRERLDALTLRLNGLLQLGRTSELTEALEAAFEAARPVTDLALRGRLDALAAMAAYRLGSLDRCATHLVQSARTLNAIELTDAATAWAWHDLALAYSFTGFHGNALAALDSARQVAVSVGLRDEEFAAPVIRLRHATALDQQGDTDGCRQVLRDVVADLGYRRAAGVLDDVRPSDLAGYGYAIARLAAHRAAAAVASAAITASAVRAGKAPAPPAQRTEPPADWDLDEARALLERSGDGLPSRSLRAMGLVCLAIAQGHPVEAVARLESVEVTELPLGHAETYRLRALAHLAAGDYASAYRADRQAFRVASAQSQRLHELFIEAVAARIDADQLRRSVTGYAEGQRIDGLTGLPDREHLEELLGAVLSRGESRLLGRCELEGLTAVNAAHGRSAGDLVLQRTAAVLNRVMRSGDLVARVDGDAFALVLPIAARPEAQEIGRRIAVAIASEDWDALVPGARIGITVGWVGVTEDSGFDSAAPVLGACRDAVREARTRRRP